ncbi:MAG: 3'-5' exonuclease [bacterium]
MSMAKWLHVHGWHCTVDEKAVLQKGIVMTNLALTRPLAVLDIEATGLNARADRIVEICVVKMSPGGGQEVHTFRVNPEVPIPAEASAVHGITNVDVVDCPTFETIAPQLNALLADCDLSGYNAINFDIPMLAEEFLRARIRFNLDGRRIVDAQRIFHKKEPRDLLAALMFFCGEKLQGAHGAEADALATAKVLDAQLARYTDLPRTVEALDEFCNPRDPAWADRSGRLKWVGNEVVINFGQKKGMPLTALAKSDAKYLKWILRGDFPRDTQEIVQRVLDTGTIPPRSAGQ